MLPTPPPTHTLHHLHNLHQLHIFRTVADQHSFSRAAEVLFLSQPGVSLQVKALEKAVGIRIFDRNGRALRLTEAPAAAASRSRPARPRGFTSCPARWAPFTRQIPT